MKHIYKSELEEKALTYATPEIEVLEISIEKGYVSSFTNGGESVSTGGDYEWNDEMEL